MSCIVLVVVFDSFIKLNWAGHKSWQVSVIGGACRLCSQCSLWQVACGMWHALAVACWPMSGAAGGNANCCRLPVCHRHRHLTGYPCLPQRHCHLIVADEIATCKLFH